MKAQSLSVQARTQLEELMLQGVLTGRVTERDLAERLKMSRAPIREAMRELINVGLLERQSSRTIVVRKLDLGEIEEIYRIRKMLEGQAAGLAALRITPYVLNQLQKLHETMIDAAKKDQFESYYERNIEFHRVIHQAAQSPRLTALIEQVMKESLLFRSRGLVDQENLEKSLQEHERLLSAFRDRDAELAELFMIRHIEGGLARLHLRNALQV